MSKKLDLLIKTKLTGRLHAYSSKIEDAFRLLPSLKKRDLHLEISSIPKRGWSCVLWDGNGEIKALSVSNKNAAEAFTRAILNYQGIKN